jgi:hypothetical protein
MDRDFFEGRAVYSSPQIQFCYGCAQDERDKGIMPGDDVELKIIGGGLYEWVKSRVADKGNISMITEAEINFMLVWLPGGTTWYSGCAKTANPKNACPSTAP